MNQRDHVQQLAKTDFAAAFKLSRSIRDVRERIQSLGWIARYAPDHQIPRVVAAANRSAGTSSDYYDDVMSLAWPLCALHETNNADLIPPLLQTALKLAVEISPASSRAEAVVLLIHAVLPAGQDLTTPAITSIKPLRNETHWRVVRAFGDVALLVNAYDRETALSIANQIAIEKKQAALVKRIESGEQLEPRPFFW